MQAIQRWMSDGGCPPWNSINPEGLREAVSNASGILLQRLGDAAGLGDAFTWRSFTLLEQAWGDFDSGYRLCHAGCFLWASADMEKLGTWADLAYQKVWERWTSSRGLALGISKLIKRGGLARWQTRALGASGLGVGAYERKIFSARRLSLEETVSNLEKVCSLNILKSFEQSSVWTGDRRQLRGLPTWLIETARARAKALGWDGWVFHAGYREYRTFMARCEIREMRQSMYKTRSKTASEYVSGCDNAVPAKKILAVRKEQAKERGFESYAAYCLSGHMIKDPDDVEKLLLDYAKAATMHALQERQDLEGWMRLNAGVSRLEPWDYRYARAAVEREAGAGAMGACQAYFAPTRTIDRCVAVVSRFLGVAHKRCRLYEKDDLMIYEITSPQGFSGFITIAPLARPIEQDMVAFEWSLSSHAKTRPVKSSSLILLQMEGSGNRMSNFSHTDVATLFHELGHAFHAILGSGRCLSEAPGAIEADALEMHSQLVEMLAWEPAVLQEIGCKKGRKMPAMMAKTISSLRNFHAGSGTIAQVTDALCDIRLHHRFNPRGRLAPWEVMVAIKKEVGLDRPKSYNREAHQLGAFVGSYVCGNYSYLWGEGLARRLFEAAWADSKKVCVSPKRNMLRERFFDMGARSSTYSQIKKYLGEKPTASWLLISRGFK